MYIASVLAECCCWSQSKTLFDEMNRRARGCTTGSRQELRSGTENTLFIFTLPVDVIS
jgi:hypothetical protein